MINCLVVDDEPIARQGIVEYVGQIDFLYLVATCKNAMDAGRYLQDQQVDLIFLDIQMPKITGLEFIRNLAEPPLVILTTAFPEYAIEGFDLNVLDYLLKPVSFERFFKAALKAQSQLRLKQRPTLITTSADYFFVKSNQKIEKINLSEILYVEAMANYVILHKAAGKHIVYMSFKGIERQLPPDLFLRIHKSFIIAMGAIENIENYEVSISGKMLPIGKTYRSSVMEIIERRLFRR